MAFRTARYAAVIVFILAMAGALVWVLLGEDGSASPEPAPTDVAEEPSASARAKKKPQPSASAPQSRKPEPSGSEAESNPKEPQESRAERLKRLRKTDAFVEFANFDRARLAPNYERALGDFGWYDPARQGLVRFANLRQLWNKVVKPIRDDLLLAGSEYRGEFLDGSVRGGVIGVVEGGRPAAQLLDFISLVEKDNGAVKVRVHAVVLDVVEQRTSSRYARGRLLERMPPFTLDPANYKTTAELGTRGIGPRVERWAQEQRGRR